MSSERRDRDADVAAESSCFGIVLRVGRVILEAWTRVELQTAGRKPVAQQAIPSLGQFCGLALEVKHGIAASRYGRCQHFSDRPEFDWNLGTGIVTALPRRSDAWIVVADTEARAVQQAVRQEPG